MSDLQEATREFLIEGHENLDQLDRDLLGLEKSSAPEEALGRIFRTLHTIKGSCSFLGFPHLEAVAHAGETLLGKLRDRKLALDSVVVEAMLRMVDAIRRMLASIEHTGSDGDVDDRELIELLTALATRKSVSVTLEIPSRARARGRLVSLAAASSGEAASAPADSAQTAPDSAVSDASVRINVDLLDKLMTIASEIVLARNQILQYSQHQTDPFFQRTCRQLDLNTTELQEHVMKTRLQPLGYVWGRLPRVVHDAALDCGKKVRLETEGSGTELDKTLIEATRDPLIHLVRNAIDHGIESPERRREAGKPEEGCVRLRAYHEAGQVNVEISDDGAGIDPEHVKRRAIEQQIITVQQASRMATESVMGLVFKPGFSTAPAVTAVSGRGVGMDVVKTNIEKIGGSVDIHSTSGQGTTVRMRIPLTLAIINVLVVSSGGDRYAIPQVSIVELVRVEGEKLRKSIHRVHDVLVYRYRDRLLPLANLNQVLELDASRTSPEDVANIVVLQAADRQFGLVVDGITDTQEIVVKPLWKQLKRLACFAGATVMGDGKVVLILDVFGLAQRAGAISDRQDWPAGESRPAALPVADRPSVLLAEASDGGRIAIPLSQVVRLEEFPGSRVERAGGRLVVQYDGQILPLLDLDDLLRAAADGTRLPSRGRSNDEAIQVVVYRGAERCVGLIVARILDIVQWDSDVEGPRPGPGVERTGVLQGRVTEVLDVDTLIVSALEG